MTKGDAVMGRKNEYERKKIWKRIGIGLVVGVLLLTSVVTTFFYAQSSEHDQDVRNANSRAKAICGAVNELRQGLVDYVADQSASTTFQIPVSVAEGDPKLTTFVENLNALLSQRGSGTSAQQQADRLDKTVKMCNVSHFNQPA